MATPSILRLLAPADWTLVAKVCFGKLFATMMFGAACVQSFAAESNSSQVVSSSFMGLHIHRATSGTSWPNVKFGAWRLWDSKVSWPYLQPKRDVFDFVLLDQYVEIAESRNVRLLLTLGLSPRWASARPDEPSSYGPGNASEPRDMASWRKFVQTVAERYRGRIMEFEIWNEPNAKDFFSGSTEDLVKLTCLAFEIIKKIDQSNVVVSPAFTGARNTRLLLEFLQKGGRGCIDVVAYHFYDPEGVPESIDPLIRQVRSVMELGGVGHLPLWNTETGWRIENKDLTPETHVPISWPKLEQRQAAAYLSRSLILARSHGLERYYFYSWDHVAMGLIEPTSKTKKLPAIAFETVGRWMSAVRANECKRSGDLWRCAVETVGTSRECIVWWSGRGTGELRLDEDSKVQRIESADGRSRHLESGAKRLEIDMMPVLIETMNGRAC